MAAKMTKAQPNDVPSVKEIAENIGVAVAIVVVAGYGGWWFWGRLKGWF